MKRIAIIDGVRTPFAKAFSVFDTIGAKDLGAIAARELIERLNFDASLIDEVVVGTVTTSGDAPNIARVVSLLAGLPEAGRAVTVSRNCASGMEALTTAFEKINAGTHKIILAGGTESMSNVPLTYSKEVQNIFMGMGRMKPHQRIAAMLKILPLLYKPVIGLQQGLTDPVCGLNMGQTAEIIAKDFGISRLEQDEFALESHLRVEKSRDILREEIVAVHPGPKYKKSIDFDNGVREGQNMEALAKLKPYFEKNTGTVTAGNSSQLTDGAAMLLTMSEEKSKALGLKPLGYLKNFAYAGLHPKRMGLGPAFAIPQALDRAGMSMKDIELFEINEAFAAQVIGCERALESKEFCAKFLGKSAAVGSWSRDKLNVNGGAIALGHPVGATGARLILTLLKEMTRRNLQTGIASLCIGGGQGGAVILERS